ncbi:uncharacterized protein LOC116138355 [Pistacia vera]|uniref:uncharacterized protein LOC116138355 n=1 Tax=Pistacia vera TaxID=55513 RepID=UPI00126345A5|nr:uncharacterized protein LOC116138355 [Pistacia vera]
MESIIEEDVLVRETHRRVPFVVCFDEATCDVRCNCRLFQFRGILCRHAIVVLIHKQISHVPEKYILRRWRKNINRHHTKVKISYNSWSTNLDRQRFDELSNLFSVVVDLASSNEDDCNMVKEMINDMKNKLMSNKSVGIYKRPNMSGNSRMICEGGDDTLKEGSSNILTPRAVHSKGRPPFKRKQSKVEKIVRKGLKELEFQELGCSCSSAEGQQLQSTNVVEFLLYVAQGSKELEFQEVGCSCPSVEGLRLVPTYASDVNELLVDGLQNSALISGETIGLDLLLRCSSARYIVFSYLGMLVIVVWWMALVHGQTKDSGEFYLEMQQQKTAFL